MIFRGCTRMTVMRLLSFFAILSIFVPSAHAQWLIEESNTTANLSGIHNVGGGIVWASGSQGTGPAHHQWWQNVAALRYTTKRRQTRFPWHPGVRREYRHRHVQRPR